MSEGDLTATSCTVGVVGADTKFLILSEADLEPYVTAMKDAEDAPAGLSCLSVLTHHEQGNTNLHLFDVRSECDQQHFGVHEQGIALQVWQLQCDLNLLMNTWMHAFTRLSS